MKISILTITCREGHIKYQIQALKDQTFKDFEWIIVDDLFGRRVVNSNFPTIHLASPDKNKSSIASCNNYAVSYASGELLYFMADYVYPLPDCLEKIWRLYQDYPNAMISGSAIQVDNMPPINEVNELTLKGHDYRRYLFKEGVFRWSNLGNERHEIFRDGVETFWLGRNDAISLETVLNCNGFEEKLDGTWGGQDAELAERLMTYGARYILDESCVCLEFPHKSGEKIGDRSQAKQQRISQKLIDRKRRDGIYLSDNPYSLRELNKLRRRYA